MEKLNPANYRATRAAQVAVHYLNYKQGSLFCHFSRRKIENHATGVHTAEILFRHTITKMAPEVNSTYNGCVKNISEDENTFYVRMRKQNYLFPADGHGNIPIEMEPFWHLGYTASSYIMWKESNESTLFNMETMVSQVTATKFLFRLHAKLQIYIIPFQGVKVLHYSQSSEIFSFLRCKGHNDSSKP
uniref:Latexin n=1 Tax=Erpetoichthys calabaricus TaxID=27687 RepID=A0A8C4S253_ERPCA